MEAQALILQPFSRAAAEALLALSVHAEYACLGGSFPLHIQQMRLVVAKLAISAYLLMIAYLHYSHEILNNTLKQAVEANIAQLSIHERTKEFLQLYLINAMYFAFTTSALMVISRNILPKVICALGLALWSYFSLFPGIPLQRILLKIMEEVCIMGGLLFIAGSEYIEASFVLSASPGQEEKQKEE